MTIVNITRGDFYATTNENITRIASGVLELVVGRVWSICGPYRIQDTAIQQSTSDSEVVFVHLAFARSIGHNQQIFTIRWHGACEITIDFR